LEGAVRPPLTEHQRSLIIGFSIGRLRQQMGGFYNMLQMQTLVNGTLKKMYDIDFNFTLEEVTEVFKDLQDAGLAKFRTPKDWESRKVDGPTSKGIPR